MPTSRCPVVRPQKPPYQWKTTDYHDWTDGTGFCRFCGQARKETQVDVLLRERHWDDEDAPPPFAWPSVMSAMQALR